MLVSRLNESTHKPFMSGFSFPSFSVVFLDVFSVGFQRQMFGGLISPVQDLGYWGRAPVSCFSEKERKFLRKEIKTGVPDVELQNLVPQGKVLYL